MLSVCIFCQEIKIWSLPKIINILGRVERRSSKRKSNLSIQPVALTYYKPFVFPWTVFLPDGVWLRQPVGCGTASHTRPQGLSLAPWLSSLSNLLFFFTVNNQFLGRHSVLVMLGFFYFITLRPDLIFFGSLGIIKMPVSWVGCWCVGRWWANQWFLSFTVTKSTQATHRSTGEISGLCV